VGADELVLVVPRELVVPDPGWRGVTAERLDATLATIATEARFEPRGLMERDPGFKQVIPYLVLRDADRYFLMRRSRAGGDVRLHDRYSIGVGGHLNPGDADVHGGLVREWHEEVEADFTPHFELVGLLNDDDTDVGRVHLGIVFVADAAGRPVAVRETEKLSGAFVPAGEVEAVRDRLETWSELAFDFLRGVVRPVR
jgi:predicted NUDIX family phosphoesterase